MAPFTSTSKGRSAQGNIPMLVGNVQIEMKVLLQLPVQIFFYLIHLHSCTFF